MQLTKKKEMTVPNRIDGYVISYCDIPEDILPDWLEEYQNGCYIAYDLNAILGLDELSDWIVANHTNVGHGDTVYIDIDY